MSRSEEVRPSNPQNDESWIILRPPQILMDLPVAYRWEVTRRHPYYLRFWELAHRHHQQPSDDLEQRNLEASAALILQAMGVSGDPPTPASGPESLGTASLSKGWESGAVAPVTLRGLVGILLAGLPAEVQVQVGQLLVNVGTSTAAPEVTAYGAVSALARLAHPALDSFSDLPMVGVNVQAPQRVVLQALEQLLRQWKEERSIPERRRDDKLEDYLAVWDRREGWAGDHYDGSREQSLRQIAQELSARLSTVASRYRSAFRLIVGRDYSPALWARVLGFLKLSDWLDPENLPRRSRHRPWRSPQRQPVSEAVLSSRSAREGPNPVLNTAGVSEAEIGMVDLVLDIQHLLTLGWSDEAIAAELELSGPGALEVIEYFRERHADAL